MVWTAKHDVKAIATAIYAFRGDVREWPIWKDGSDCKPADGGLSTGKACDLLRSADGNWPAVDGSVALASEWLSSNFDTIENQLVWGVPSGDVAKKYPDRSGNTTSPFRGPYLSNSLIPEMTGAAMILFMSSAPINFGQNQKTKGGQLSAAAFFVSRWRIKSIFPLPVSPLNQFLFCRGEF